MGLGSGVNAKIALKFRRLLYNFSQYFTNKLTHSLNFSVLFFRISLASLRRFTKKNAIFLKNLVIKSPAKNTCSVGDFAGDRYCKKDELLQAAKNVAISF